MVLDITAASAAASELKQTWGVTAALLVLLLAVAWFLELGNESRVLVDGPLALPPMPASQTQAAASDLVDRAVSLTPAFTIAAPTTLTITLHRDATEGWVAVDLALIEEETGEIRQLGLRTEVRQTVGADLEAQREASVLVDRVIPGRYVVRIAPAWEPLGPVGGLHDAAMHAAAPPPTASLRIVEGRRSFWGLALAALALLLPAIFVSLRAAARSKRAAAHRPAEPREETPKESIESTEMGDGTHDS